MAAKKSPTKKPAAPAAAKLTGIISAPLGKTPEPFAPEPFAPEIWQCEGSADAPILVCARRVMRGPKVSGGNGFSYIFHAVAITVPNTAELPTIILPAISRDHRIKWKRHAPTQGEIGRITKGAGMIECGFWKISIRAAQAALAEAWRCVDCSRDIATMAPVCAINPLRAFSFHKGSTVFRNILAWLSWDGWNRAGFTLEQRAETLRGMGFDCTDKALDRAREEAELQLP